LADFFALDWVTAVCEKLLRPKLGIRPGGFDGFGLKGEKMGLKYET
jgi:hypothetical protein